MAYEQAQIPVQKVAEFEQLRSAIERIFSSDALTRFYARLESKGIAARAFERILEQRLLEEADKALAAGGKNASEIYRALALSDQALMREFYLERVERVDPKIRLKYRKVYEYR
jgi:AraC-like DNA-binding protein